MSGKSHTPLSWTHYRIPLQVDDEQARFWYEREAAEQTWSVRTLQRNMDMYVRMYDELKRGEGDNPTLGIVLRDDTGEEDTAKYSVLHGNEQLFASKYLGYLPTENQLRHKIEVQKTFFWL